MISTKLQLNMLRNMAHLSRNTNYLKLKISSLLFSSSQNKVHHVCIVGSGPAGFYAAMHLTKKLTNVKVDIIEKLPVPFGLIR